MHHFYIIIHGLFLVSFLSLAPTQSLAKAQKPECALLTVDQGRVKSISKNNIITLEDERQLILANIFISRSHKSISYIKSLKGQLISFYPSGRIKDRYNRLIVQVVTPNSKTIPWFQASLIQAGLAQMTASTHNTLCATALLEYEKQARKAGVGEWKKGKSFKILDSQNIELLNSKAQGSFQVVKGKLVGVGRSGKRTYLNFSENWNKDFTAIISNHLLKRKTSTWPDLKSLIGKTIIVHGWLDHWNGPMIRLETPEMLEVYNENKSAK